MPVLNEYYMIYKHYNYKDTNWLAKYERSGGRIGMSGGPGIGYYDYTHGGNFDFEQSQWRIATLSVVLPLVDPKYNLPNELRAFIKEFLIHLALKEI